jgi:hypothetical protein
MKIKKSSWHYCIWMWASEILDASLDPPAPIAYWAQVVLLPLLAVLLLVFVQLAIFVLQSSRLLSSICGILAGFGSLPLQSWWQRPLWSQELWEWSRFRPEITRNIWAGWLTLLIIAGFSWEVRRSGWKEAGINLLYLAGGIGLACLSLWLSGRIAKSKPVQFSEEEDGPGSG